MRLLILLQACINFSNNYIVNTKISKAVVYIYIIIFKIEKQHKIILEKKI